MKWKTAKVSSLCDLKNGKAYNADDWATEGLPIIRIQNLNNSSKGFNYWSGTLDKQIHVRPKDLLLAWSGTPGTSFGAHIWNGPEGVLNQHIFRIDILYGNIEKRWFQFCLNQQLNSLIHQAHGGVGLKHVTKGAVHALEIPLPPLAEQKRIAAILDAADALRAKRREALAQLDALLQSTFLSLFGDPVSNPMRWEDSSLLGTLAEIVSGVAKGRKLGDKNVRIFPYLAVANVQDKYLKLDVVKSIEATDEEIAKYRLIKDDLLLTEGGDPDKLGRGSLWHDGLPECIHQNHIFRVRITSAKIDPIYLNWLIGSQRGKKYFLRSAKQTTGIASINMTQLRAFPMLIPPASPPTKIRRHRWIHRAPEDRAARPPRRTGRPLRRSPAPRLWRGTLIH